MNRVTLVVKGTEAEAHKAAHDRHIPATVRSCLRSYETVLEIPCSESILNRVVDWYAEDHDFNTVLPVGSLLLWRVL